MEPWTTSQIRSQHAKSAVVTGANSGLGFQVALELARAGSSVILACRNMSKGEEALAQIRRQVRHARVNLDRLDLADLESVRSFAERTLRRGKLDLLINNAGVLALPQREITAQGFETQFGVNHLGHFALTAWLLPALLLAKKPRVVAVSSLAHGWAILDFADLQGRHFYSPWGAYAQSKLANLLFARELQVRSDAARCRLLSVAAHPGLSATNLLPAGPGSSGLSWSTSFLILAGSLVSQSAAQGALPILYAATAPEVRGGGFYGPDGFGEFWGYPTPAWVAPQATDRNRALKLWRISEQLTGINYQALRQARDRQIRGGQAISASG